MAYNFNGQEVGLILNVGNNLHNVCTQFTGYNEITEQEYIRLPEQDRKNRVDAFYAYLSGTYNTDIRQLVKLNPEFPDIRVNNDTCKPKTKPIIIKAFGTYGKVNGLEIFEQEYAKNEICTLQANTDNSYAIFDGWYVDGIRINHSSETYSFNVTDAVTIEGRYINNESITIDGVSSKQQNYTWLGLPKGNTFVIAATSAWHVTESSSWMSFSHVEAPGGATTITVNANEHLFSTEGREGILRFSLKNGFGFCTLKVVQSKAGPISVHLDCDFPSSGKFKVYGSTTYAPVELKIEGTVVFNRDTYAGGGHESVDFKITIPKYGSEGLSESFEPGEDFSRFNYNFNKKSVSPDTYGGQPIRI